MLIQKFKLKGGSCSTSLKDNLILYSTIISVATFWMINYIHSSVEDLHCRYFLTLKSHIRINQQASEKWLQYLIKKLIKFEPFIQKISKVINKKIDATTFLDLQETSWTGHFQAGGLGNAVYWNELVPPIWLSWTIFCEVS